MDRLRILLLTFVLQLAGTLPVVAQTKTPASPVLHYTLRIDANDLSGYTVSIRVYHAPHRFRLAMATHHEYDDRYWRFVTDFHAEAPASFTREDSAVWSITTSGEEALVSYRIRLLPLPPPHFSQRPFLSPVGGLVGDLHSFMYLVEDTHTPCRLTLQLPYGWEAATGLDPMPAPAASEPPLDFLVSSALQLLDAPILVGRLHSWHFVVDGTPHEVAYLSMTPTLSFDSIALVANIQKIVRQTAGIFNSFPYRHYSFLLEDASAGALEHGNSVTIGATAADLSSARPDIYGEIAHELFHSWNGMSIRPSGFTELNYGPQQLTTGLWFNEGVTMFYTDLIGRKTGMPVDDSTRLAHLTNLITRYYRDTGNSVLPPARVSLADYVQPGPLGDYSASTHLQGELLATCMDMLIRDATNGQYCFDDVMRRVYRHHGGQEPFRDTDIENEVTAVCGCKEAHTFFEDYLYQGKPIDFASFLSRVGLRLQHDQPSAIDRQGRPLPDTRVFSWILRDDTSLRIGITNPNSCWAMAGIHTGDIITAINGLPMHTRSDFQTAMNRLHIGDTALLRLKKETGTKIVPVYITGYSTPLITLTEDPAANTKQRRLLQQWKDGLR
jgi:predicted metalloprotease with PDZ domain